MRNCIAIALTLQLPICYTVQFHYMPPVVVIISIACGESPRRSYPGIVGRGQILTSHLLPLVTTSS